MTETTVPKRLISQFVTPTSLSTEERRRRCTLVRRIAWAQLIGLLVIVVGYAIAVWVNPQQPVHALAWAGLALLLMSCVAAIWFTYVARPREGAWLLVVFTTFAVALIAGYESAVDPKQSLSLSVMLFLWPIVVAGTTLPANTAFIVAGLDTLLFLLPNLLLSWAGANQSIGVSMLLLRHTPSVVISFFFVAYISQRNAAFLMKTIEESEQRAQEILTASEALLEKNLQQLELATQLSTSAAELSETSKEQASGSAQQAAAISQVTSTIEEMGYTARQIAQSAENVAQVSEQSLEAVGRGQTSMDESVSAMEGIRRRVQELADKVLGLGEQSQRIGEIIDIINDIADETHLLALNAAIESAGAGEYGRRFAVVASEVKNLANRAMDSAKEVRGIIDEIQKATNASVMAAEEGLKETQRGVQQVYEAGQAIEQIVMLAQRTTEAAQEISLSTTQQRTASEQIVETMREIAEVSTQTAEGSRQLANAATTLTSIAERLQRTGK